LNILLRNGRLIDPLTRRDEVVDLLIRNGRIEKIGPHLNGGDGVEVKELKGILVLPGFIDMHVHLREPGYEHKETIETGTLAAATGGFTGVCCMPNTNPAIDDASVVRLIKERASSANGGIVDVYPVAAITLGRQGKQLTPMIELAEAGAVGFSDDGDPVRDSEVMRRALEYSAMSGKPLIQHAEESALTKGGVMNEGAVSTSLGMPPMPPVAEEIMVSRDLHLLSYTGGQYHVAHVSTAASIARIASGKKAGLRVTCEVSPHHFTLTDEAVRSFSTNTKMNPPLRSREDVEAMKEGLRDGTIDAIATDHAPHSYDEKEVEFLHAPFGIVGLETAVGLAFTMLLAPKILDLMSLVDKFSTNPRKILHLPALRVAEGEPANLTLIDPDAEWTVSVRDFKSKSKNSPFDGWKLRGKAVGIINNDHVVWAAR
jgi:dihydroorotase